MKYRIKIQEIKGDKKETVLEETCEGFVGMLKKGDHVGCEFGGNISDAEIADLMISSPHMMEVHKLITAYNVAKAMRKMVDPEDEMADRIGGLQ